MTNLTANNEVPHGLAKEWEEITNIVAEVADVTSCLVMRGNENSMEVMARSLSEGNPYTPGETAPRDNKLYCETVIATRKPLEVINSHEDEDWKGNPDEALGLMSYYGVPVDWPSGENFGTLCILDKAPHIPTSLEKNLIRKFANLIEYSLANIAQKSRGVD